MAHPNAQLLHQAYDAFAAGDIPTVLRILAEDITWHVPGRSPLSGDYEGHGAFRVAVRSLGDGTYRPRRRPDSCRRPE